MTKQERMMGINPMAIPGMGKREVVHKIQHVFETVADYFEIAYVDMRSKSRKREIIIPRHIYYYMARKYTNCTLSYIGRYGANEYWIASHSNVHSNIRKVEHLIGYDEEYTQAVKELTELFEANKYG